KVNRLTVKFSFSTSLDATEIPSPSAKWRVLGKDEEVYVPVVTDSTIKGYQKAKYAGGKRAIPKKLLECFLAPYSFRQSPKGRKPFSCDVYQSEHAKNPTQEVFFRPVTMQFLDNKPIKAYCSLCSWQEWLCCHAIALLIQLNFYNSHKKLHLHMSCTEKLQKWHAKGSTRTSKSSYTDKA
ncbi:hypothetical protein OS493_039132, partial [Desmophyllum pertusum]